MEFCDEDLPEEFAKEAKDVLKELRRREVARTRSMSPNFVHRRIRRRTGDTQESADSEPKNLVHLEDLPRQELEGAPAGWGSSRRSQRSESSTEQHLPVPSLNRRRSAFPATGLGLGVEMRRSSAVGRRRESQMTFEEWCQLKKFQELHASAQKEHEDSSSDLEHIKNMKSNISFDEWSRASEERQKRMAVESEKSKLKEEQEREAMERAKYRRKISYDKWTEDKNKTTEDRRRKISDLGPSTFHMQDDRRKKSDEAHQKWLLKKELAQMRKDRQDMLRRSSLKTSDLPTK